MSSIRKIAELNLIDLEYRRQNDRIAENAVRNRTGNVVKAPLNPIQNEMVADFKSIYGKPKEIKDADGNIIKYKLYERPTLNFEPVLIDDIGQIMDNDEINKKYEIIKKHIMSEYPKIHKQNVAESKNIYESELQLIKNDIKKYEKALDKEYAIKANLEYDLIKLENEKDDLNKITEDETKTNIEKDEAYTFMDLIDEKIDSIKSTELQNNNNKIEDYKNEIQKFKNELHIKSNIPSSEIYKDEKEWEHEYNNILAVLKIKKDELLEQNEENKQKEKKNLEMVNIYRNQLKELNSGMFNTEKQPNETVEEYYNRLHETAQEDYPEYLLEDAAFTITQEFRKKLKEIIKTQSDIELIINSMDPLGKAEHQQMILKQFPLVKDEFIKIYGIDNKYVKPNDVIEFFKLFYSDNNNELNTNITNKITNSNIKLTDAAIKAKLTSVIINKDFIITNNDYPDNKLYLRIYNEQDDNNGSFILLYSIEEGKSGTYKEWIDTMIKTEKNKKIINTSKIRRREDIPSSDIVKNATHINAYMINKYLSNSKSINTINPDMIAHNLYENYKLEPYHIHDLIAIKQVPEFIENKKIHPSYIVYGMGNEEYPKKVKFGDVFILLRKLYYDNLLSVVNSHSLQIRGFKMQKVSDTFTNIIINMVNNISPKHTDINSLNDKEKLLFDRLISVSNLHKKIINNKESTIEKLKQRMKLIEAEIEIGNNNPDLINELHDILYSLKDYKVITIVQARQYLKQFK